MMIEAWINRMIEVSSKLIIGVKEIYGKAIEQIEEISRDLENSKE